MRQCRRLASFLALSPSNIEEVSPNCCVFLVLSSSKPEDFSQNSFVFKLADRHVDR